MMVNKRELLKQLCASLSATAHGMSEATDAQRLDVCKQEGAMQSRYDTHRIEGSWLADAMHLREKNLKQEFGYAQAYVLPETSEYVGEGSLVRVSSGGVHTLYFILPFAAGKEAELNGEEVVVITPHSPLAQELLGRKQGEVVRFRNQVLAIEGLE